MPDDHLEKYYSVSAVAEAVGAKPQWVRGQIHNGGLRAYRVGLNLMLKLRDVQEFMENNVSQGPAEQLQTRKAQK